MNGARGKLSGGTSTRFPFGPTRLVYFRVVGLIQWDQHTIFYVEQEPSIESGAERRHATRKPWSFESQTRAAPLHYTLAPPMKQS